VCDGRLRVGDIVGEVVIEGRTEIVDEDVGLQESERLGDGWLQVAERERLGSVLGDGVSVPVRDDVLVGGTVTLPVRE